ncbi:acyltransferase domain-containing protein [Dactylosporangium sp. NBC_01737]|uniref:acyltransferase domain-containing protein n=1 Tax=Dactylosporangium sp. NBC_01737 TaxID=2975959 RepID=UPI002E0DD125|nr:acyltransferase domain-containing protein [Dactylosporangium sp. NBC_01737]
MGRPPAGRGPDVPFPDADDLPDALLDLSVPHDAVNDIVAVHRATPDLARLRDRCAWTVLSGLGAVYDGNADLRALPPSLGAAGRLLAVFVAVAVAPHTVRHNAALGIAPTVTLRSLADIGRQVAKHRLRHGVPGVLSPYWLGNALRGQLFELGRLQFQRAVLGRRTGAAAGHPGGPCLDLHIPDFRGPITPSACDRSIDAAHAFFATHFPDEAPAVATCHSWLLDRQLAALLPPGSNITAFQRRFTPAYQAETPTDTDLLDFVFDDPALPLDRLPRDTTLRRVVLDHLGAGGHWYEGSGWFPW